MEHTNEVMTQTEKIYQKKGKPRKLDVDPNMSYIEYRRLNQNLNYKERPRYIPKPKKSPGEIKEREREKARQYYEANKEKMKAQIIEADKRKREARRMQTIIYEYEKLQLSLKESQSI